MVVSKASVEGYKWGENCEAWTLLENSGLSIKQEKMPGGTSEVLHEHKKTQQFFFILQGEGIMEMNNERYPMKAGEGLHIVPGCRHRIINETKEVLDFLVISEPSINGDRNELK